MDTRKAFMFALIAIFFSMIAIGISDSAITTEYYNSTFISGGIVYFLHNTTSNISDSKDMNLTVLADLPVAYTNVSALGIGNTNIANWTTQPLDYPTIPNGAWVLHIHATRTSLTGTNTLKLYYVTWKHNLTGGNLSLLGTSELSAEILETDTENDISVVIPSTTFNESVDRITIKLYAQLSGVGTSSVSMSFDDLTDSRLTIPSDAITQLEIIDLMQPYLDGKVNKSGDTMTGTLDMNSNTISTVVGDYTSRVTLTEAQAVIAVNNTETSGIYVLPGDVGFDVNSVRVMDVGENETYINNDLYVAGNLGVNSIGGLNLTRPNVTGYLNIKFTGDGVIESNSNFVFKPGTGTVYTFVPGVNSFFRAYAGSGVSNYTDITHDGTNGYLRSGRGNIIIPNPLVLTNLADTKTTALCIDANEKIYRSTNASSNYLTC